MAVAEDVVATCRGVFPSLYPMLSWPLVLNHGMRRAIDLHFFFKDRQGIDTEKTPLCYAYPHFCIFIYVRQVRNDLTSAEFALNLNAFQVDRSATAAVEGVSDGVMGEGKGGKGEGGGGAKSKIDYDSIAERLEASLRTLQAGRPLSLLEAISEGEVGLKLPFPVGGLMLL